MALNFLTIGTMVDLTSDWVKPSHAVRLAFLRTPELAGLLPQIDKAHFGLLDAQRQPVAKTIAEIMADRTVTDHRHDSYARSVYYALESHIQHAYAVGNLAYAQALVQLRDLLFPYGLRVVNFSYREESGQAELLASRMTPEIRQELDTLPMKQGSVLDLVKGWLEAGADLGRLEKALGSKQLPGERIQLAPVRAAWTRIIHAVRTVADLIEDLDPAIADALGQIELAEAAAERTRGETPTTTGDTPAEEPAAEEPAAEEPAIDEPVLEEPAEPADTMTAD